MADSNNLKVMAPALKWTNDVKPQIHLAVAKTVEVGRSAKTGRFIPVKEAIKHPSTTVVEKVKVGPTKHRNK